MLFVGFSFLVFLLLRFIWEGEGGFLKKKKKTKHKTILILFVFRKSQGFYSMYVKLYEKKLITLKLINKKRFWLFEKKKKINKFWKMSSIHEKLRILKHGLSLLHPWLNIVVVKKRLAVIKQGFVLKID